MKIKRIRSYFINKSIIICWQAVLSICNETTLKSMEFLTVWNNFWSLTVLQLNRVLEAAKHAIYCFWPALNFTFIDFSRSLT